MIKIHLKFLKTQLILNKLQLNALNRIKYAFLFYFALSFV